MADAFGRTAVKTITDGDVAAKITDGTDTLLINADGSINAALAAGTEVKITDGTDDLAVNADGSINVAVTAALPAGTNVIGEVKVTDGTDDLAINSSGAAAADITHIAGTAPGAGNPLPSRLSDGSAFISGSNPLPVAVVDNVPGTVVTDPQTSADIAGNAGTGTISYTLVTNALAATLRALTISSSVQFKAKLEAYNGTTAAEVGTYVLPTAGGSMVIPLERAGEDAGLQLTGDGAAVRFRLQLTNLDKNDTAACYSTLVWSEA